ncbi:DNA repair protein XRCC3 [Stylophora pistillata]|uniref:DNA repair protein XRCC3 n=1 Tax=Stylophora pistillata TaxID=50429 RepID=A0A2B4SGH5_STYPI|nr:DNA repair protein XRCC3 [Stylophora pistillata]
MSQSDGQSDRLLDNQSVVCFTLISAKLTNKTTILCMSAADLERATKLSSFDVSVLLKAVALSLPCPPMRTALSLYRDSQGHRLSLGCQILDGFLRGGILSEGITEITGVSSSGKTQVCLQLCLSVQLPHEQGGLEGAPKDDHIVITSNYEEGAVYISTEDVFPSKRLHQLIQSFTKSQAVHLVSCKWNLSYNVFIEHAADVDDLQNIITHRLPLLLHRRAIKLVIIDSITALFRVEYSLGEMSKRAKVLRCFGAQLHKLSHLYSFPVVCVNQSPLQPLFGGEESVLCDETKQWLQSRPSPLTLMKRVCMDIKKSGAEDMKELDSQDS